MKLRFVVKNGETMAKNIKREIQIEKNSDRKANNVLVPVFIFTSFFVYYYLKSEFIRYIYLFGL